MARFAPKGVSWAVLGAVMLCAVVSASAQVPPPSRDRDSGRQVPRYVDDADYDPQPYYVDGVQYKPYVPEQKRAKPAASSASASPQQSTTPAVPDLKPYVPPSSVAAKAESEKVASSASSTVSSSSSSSSTYSASAYVPKKRPRYGAAVIEALDKVTAESVRFEAPVGQPVRYKGLIYLVKACETEAEDEAQADAIAYMQVRTSPVAATASSPGSRSREIFQGWSFSSSPSLNPIEHPTYDAWVVGCRMPISGTAG